MFDAIDGYWARVHDAPSSSLLTGIFHAVLEYKAQTLFYEMGAKGPISLWILPPSVYVRVLRTATPEELAALDAFSPPDLDRSPPARRVHGY